MKVKVNNSTINISKGNSKMGGVYSFSVTPIITCAEGVPCKKECYACKLCRIYPTVRNAYAQNLAAIESESVGDIANAITEVIKVKKVKYFRFNVSGDFKSKKYFEIAVKVAQNCPGTKFLAFTKVFDILDIERPKNFNLVASVWNDFAPQSIEKYATAHYCDGSRPMPQNAVKCGGNCEKCGLCFELKRGQAVYFEKH